MLIKPPSFLPLVQESLRKWEETACLRSYMCNQANGLNRCLRQVHNDLATHLSGLQLEAASGGLSPTAQAIVEELGAALSFQQSVTGSLSRPVTD